MYKAVVLQWGWKQKSSHIKCASERGEWRGFSSESWLQFGLEFLVFQGFFSVTHVITSDLYFMCYFVGLPLCILSSFPSHAFILFSPCLITVMCVTCVLLTFPCAASCHIVLTFPSHCPVLLFISNLTVSLLPIFRLNSLLYTTPGL